MWIAQYEVNKPENSGTWKSWAGWQYTDVGRVSGISNNVDRDKFTKEIFMSEGTQIPDTEKPKPDEEDDKTTTKKKKNKMGRHIISASYKIQHNSCRACKVKQYSESKLDICRKLFNSSC